MNPGLEIRKPSSMRSISSSSSSSRLRKARKPRFVKNKLAHGIFGLILLAGLGVFVGSWI
ncbi:hypothetical protein DL95DRAFT_384634, partial [Leptodontidium sp. 2 PMI_412]